VKEIIPTGAEQVMAGKKFVGKGEDEPGPAGIQARMYIEITSIGSHLANPAERSPKLPC
jgi:hypothetical protein